MWPWFLVCTVLGLVLVPFRIGEFHVTLLTSNVDLQAALLRGIGLFDMVWITLAAVCTYLYTVQADGLAHARQWAIRIALVSLVIGICNSLTGFPLGPALYTDKMGFPLAKTVPYTYPLLWLTLILCSYYTAGALLALLPAFRQKVAPQWLTALGAATLVLVTEINFEPIAWNNRFYWIWYPRDYEAPQWPPVQNFLTWFVVAFSLTFFHIRKASAAPFSLASGARPMAILALFNAVPLAAHLFR
jgi:uncharacterized membrane protein